MLACKDCSSIKRVRLRSTGNKRGAPLNGMPVHTRHVDVCFWRIDSITVYGERPDKCTKAAYLNDVML